VGFGRWLLSAAALALILSGCGAEGETEAGDGSTDAVGDPDIGGGDSADDVGAEEAGGQPDTGSPDSGGTPDSSTDAEGGDVQADTVDTIEDTEGAGDSSDAAPDVGVDAEADVTDGEQEGDGSEPDADGGGTGADATDVGTDDAEVSSDASEPDAEIPVDAVEDVASDATGEDATADATVDVYVPPTWKCTKDGDCALQFDDLTPCEKAVCDLAAGACDIATRPDGFACSDGDPCSVGDSCTAGQCQPKSLACDDDNLCTDDTCYPGIGCINKQNLLACNDGDSCTSEDRCTDGTCTGKGIDCDDQEPCTLDFCVDGACVHQVIPADDCCFLEVTKWQFDGGTLLGWNPVNTSSTVGWTLSNQRSASGTFAAHYGKPKGAGFDTPGQANSGKLTSQPVLMPTAGAITLSFQLYLDVEITSTKDKLWVYALTSAGDKVPLWHKTTEALLLQFQEIQADLSEFAGEVIQIQFDFDTVDASTNGLEGVYIDDIFVFSTCVAIPCETDAECNDGVQCTTDSCQAGTCKNTLVAGCCTSNFQCDDDNTCTTDACVANQCVYADNTKPCNDKDPCTIKDQCAAGACIGEPKNCSDGTACTDDACVDGECVWTPTENPGCCNLNLGEWSFNDGALGSWVSSPPAAWSPSNETAADWPYALSYSSAAGVGQVQAPLVALPLYVGLRAELWVYVQAPAGQAPPSLTVSAINPGGKSFVLWTQPANFPLGQWTWVSIDAGSLIDDGGLRLVFQGSPGGAGSKLFIDAPRLWVPCSATACTADAPAVCDDGDPSTADSCANGACASSPILWACTSDQDCGDLKLCTEEACVAGQCVFTVAPGCCETAADCADGIACSEDICLGLGGCTYAPQAGPCNDGDACTLGDSCSGTKCVGTPKNCDDGSGCTASSCSDGECEYTYTGGPGCCDFDAQSFAFSEALAPAGWTFVQSSQVVRWQLSDHKYTSGPSSLYYGNPAIQSYNGGKTSGSATSPPITLPNAVETTLALYTFVDVEQDPEFDQFWISVIDEANKPTVVWSKTADFVFVKWTPLEISLAPWSGRTIRLRLSFDSVDAAGNSREGIYVDDMRLHVGCPPEPCTSTPQCHDDKLCTVDACVGGFCDHAPVEGCCVADADCNDFNYCTIDACIGGKCKSESIPGCCFSSDECEDGNVCTADVCDPVAGCLHVPNTAFCTDGDLCTVSDKCSNGVCKGTPIACDDDDDVCTTDSCKQGTCVFTPTGADGCCQTAADCSDGDPCTVESCVEGSCNLVNTCCQSDLECSDGDDVCTIDTCVAGDCIYQQTNAPGCCNPLPASYAFAVGNPQGFTFSNGSPFSKWQVHTGKSKSAPAALYYGNPSIGSYNDGQTSGAVTSPAVAIPNKNGVQLRFWLYMDTESSVSYDQLFVYALAGGAPATIWSKSSYATGAMAVWKQMVVNLDAYKGKNVQFQWFFNTIDGVFNSTEGVYVDDIEIVVPCP
jgi:hypothetical protein